MERKHKMSIVSLLPEGCISKIISLTSAGDACRATLVSREFRSAAESDTVWERFLPLDYEEIISRSVSPPVYTTKRELYFHLCSSDVLLDNGKLSLAMNKWNGKKSYMLSARELSIASIDNPDYWKWTTNPESRFPKVAEALKVWWLEIQGKMPTKKLSPNTIYTAHFVFRLCTENPFVFGLRFPIKVSVRHFQETTNEADQNKEPRYIRLEEASNFGYPLESRKYHGCLLPLVKMRTDGWTEIEIGEFFNGHGGDEGEVEIQLVENEVPLWKGGFVVEGIELRPKDEHTMQGL